MSDTLDYDSYDEHGRGYWLCKDLDTRGDSEDGVDKEVREPSVRCQANLLSSLCEDGLHRPVLDFDIPARLIPSSTPGHTHLYIDLPVGCSWESYERLLLAMRDCGILQPGYVNASTRRECTHVRPEWVKKPAEEPNGD